MPFFRLQPTIFSKLRFLSAKFAANTLAFCNHSACTCLQVLILLALSCGRINKIPPRISFGKRQQNPLNIPKDRYNHHLINKTPPTHKLEARLKVIRLLLLHFVYLILQYFLGQRQSTAESGISVQSRRHDIWIDSLRQSRMMDITVQQLANLLSY
jgi:hypothetical protein